MHTCLLVCQPARQPMFGSNPSGSNIYIYRNMRPYYKAVLPPENVNTEEKDIW